jgi:hypothetical protein
MLLMFPGAACLLPQTVAPKLGLRISEGELTSILRRLQEIFTGPDSFFLFSGGERFRRLRGCHSEKVGNEEPLVILNSFP